jgi:hypothetical protein
VVDPGRDQDRLERFRCRQQQIRRLAKDPVARGSANVPVPQSGPAPYHRGVSLDSRCQVIEQGAERADVERREPLPAFYGHAGQQRKNRCLGLAPRCRGKKQDVVAGVDWPYGLKLGRAKVGPPESVDDMVPERRVELLEGVHGSNATSSTDDAAAVARSAGVISRWSRVGA